MAIAAAGVAGHEARAERTKDRYYDPPRYEKKGPNVPTIRVRKCRYIRVPDPNYRPTKPGIYEVPTVEKLVCE
jgi:hypothetical protein